MSTVLNTDYTRFTYQDLLEDFSNRLQADERFKNISSASIYGLFMEMLASCVDMTNYYMSRTAEEAFIDTARLDSSVIKHGKNYGYNPIRNTPAEAEIKIVLKGPLPSHLQEGAVVYFAQSETNLSFNSNPFMLNTDYSYTFTKNDITDGQSSTWTKTLIYSVPQESVRYFKLGDYKQYQQSETTPIKIFQGKVIEEEFKASNNYNKLGKPFQFYDIDDLKFSNWYSKRDPNGYSENTYYPKNSYTKVAIGKTKEAAIDSGYFTIDDENIYVNDLVLNADGNLLSEPLRVCAITTNSDKTIRIMFGDGNLVRNGLNTDNESIYVEYLQTNGSDANAVGSTGAELTCNSSFYATQQGNIVDVTNNVKFVINSDITGGVNFESKESIKNNAPAFYAANKKLITKQDFVSYFKTLTTPIKVQNAIAWSVEDFEDVSTTYDKLLNYVFYCIAGQVYNINGKNNTFVNVLSDDGYKNGTFTVYGNGQTYLNKLCDYALLTEAPEKIYSEQYGTDTEEWQKRITKIRKNCEDRMIINSKMFSMPPIVQYFDVVGNVEIDTLSKLQGLKTEVENKIYAWLNDNCKFGQKIYKSDIIKFFNEYNNIRSTDLNIKVSELLYKEPETYNFDGWKVYLSRDTSLVSDLKNSAWNVITFPLYDNTGKKLSKDMFNGQTIEVISVNKYSYDSQKKKVKLDNANGTISVINKLNPIVNKITINENKQEITIPVYGSHSRPSTYDSAPASFEYYFQGESSDPDKDYIESGSILKINSEYDFTKTSKLNTTVKDAYGELASKNYISTILTEIANWINGSTKSSTTSGRPIDLPYTVEWTQEANSEVRKETIIRKGNLQANELSSQVNEHSFWYYVVKTLIYPAFKDQIENGEYSNFERFVYDVYSTIKHVLADSILDDNNNIINYSMPNEIPVIRLNIQYNYRK